MVRKMSQNTRDQLEQVSPWRMWTIARHAVGEGWDVLIHATASGWRLVLREAHHCVHLRWEPNAGTANLGRPWKLRTGNLSTRCPTGERVRIKDLEVWLAEHPDVCEQSNTRAPLDELPRTAGCDDHVGLHEHPEEAS